MAFVRNDSRALMICSRRRPDMPHQEAKQDGEQDAERGDQPIDKAPFVVRVNR